MKKIFIFLFLLLLIGCENKPVDSIFDYFSKTELLKHQVLEISDFSDHILNPEALFVKDNLLIIHEVRISNFSAIDLAEKKVLTSWGRQGEGPGELLGIMDFCNNYKNSGISTWDATLKRLYFCSYDSMFDNSEVSFQNILEDVTNKNLFDDRFTNVLQINESLFLGVGGSGEKRYKMIDIEQNKIFDTGEYPSMDQVANAKPFVRHMAYHGINRLNKKEMKMAYSSFESEMFEIFKIDDKGLTLDYGNYTTIPLYNQTSSNLGTTTKIERKELKGMNHWMSTSEKYIYILYSKREDWGSPQFSQQGGDLLVFDRKGKPVAHYELDCLVKSIAVNEHSNRIYAISVNEEPQIIYFDL